MSGNHGIFVVKTSHTRSPKKSLNEHMKDIPGDIWIVLEATIGDERLFTVGYK